MTQVVYESTDGLHVRLEARPGTDSQGFHYTHHRLITAHGNPGAVIIAESRDAVIFVQTNPAQPSNQLWELPRGSAESQDRRELESVPADSTLADNHIDGLLSKAQIQSVICTALRELSEETGVQATNAQFLGSYVCDSSIYPQIAGVVHCQVDTTQDSNETDGEIQRMKWVAREEISAMISRGEITDGHSLAALSIWLLGTRHR